MATNQDENDGFANGTPRLTSASIETFQMKNISVVHRVRADRTNRSTIARCKKASFEQSTEQQLFQQRPRQLARNRG